MPVLLIAYKLKLVCLIIFVGRHFCWYPSSRFTIPPGRIPVKSQGLREHRLTIN